MGNVMAYSGIAAKIHAMQAKLLTAEDFENIASMKSVLEIISFLKDRSTYAPFISQMDESLYHRRHVEKILFLSLYADYTKLFRFGGMEQKQFLKLYLKRYEVNLINYCFRIVFNHYDLPFDLNYKKDFFNKYSQISIDRLTTSRNIGELVENLKDTEYYAPLKKIYDAGAEALFDYDLALDIYYFTTTWKSRSRILKKKELDIFTRDCGSKIDLLNLQWIYRAKKYYNMLPPDIYTLTIPIHYRIPLDVFKNLVEAPSIEEYGHIMENTVYARKYDFDQNKTIEKMYRECLYKLYLSDRRKNPYSIASINTYLFLKEEEIEKLTTALECVRYSLTSRETLEYLGGVTN